MENSNSSLTADGSFEQSPVLSDIATVADCVPSLFAGLRPPPDITIDQWADSHRRLPSESSDESGPWRTTRTPYLREPMIELSASSPASDVVIMKGSQVGATEVLQNFILYSIDIGTGPILTAQPTIELARDFSSQRLAPSIKLCKPVRGKIADAKSRDKANTTLRKTFPGGFLAIAGANSAAALRSKPVPNLALDEIDGYPDDVEGEGDPVELAKRRTTNWSRAKRLYVSTPTVANASRIAKLFEASDQRYFYVPCPHCNKPQIISWKNIEYENDDPSTAHLRCIHCSARIEEYHKTWMLENGQWIKHNPKSKTPGFHLSALYSPLGWYSWVDAVDEHLKARGDPLKRKVWVNTVLGEVWEEAQVTIDHHWLEKRKEEYPEIVPAPCLVLTAGVDVQGDRLECTVVGHGLQGESWVIEHEIFPGNTKLATTWELLDQYLLTTFTHERGIDMHIACTCIDSGFSTDEVYAFCEARRNRRVFAVKGMHGPGRPIVCGHSKPKKDKRVYNITLFTLGVDQAKETLYERLMIKDPGPGFVHFPSHLEPVYFQQLTAEKRVRRHSAGLPRLVWELPAGRRNETLDCYVYNLAALKILNPNLDVMARENIVFTSDFSKMAASGKRGRRVRSKGVQV